MDGVIGKFFFQFGITMSAAVLLSLLEAVTITPMRAAAFLSSEPKVSKFEAKLDHIFESLARLYGRSLVHTLNWKHTVVITSLIFFGVSMFLVQKLRQEFVPAQDQDIIMVQAQTKPGSSLEFTSEVAKGLEEVIRKDPNVQGFYVSVGAGGPSAQVNQISMPVTLIAKDKRKLSHTEIMNQWRGEFKKLKGLRVTMRDISARNMTSGRLNPVALSLRGPDLGVLDKASQELMKQLDDAGLAVDLDTDYRVGIPELIVLPDRRKMFERGVSVDSIGEILSAGVGGLRKGRFTADGRRYDIRFKILDAQIRSAKDLEKLYVRNVAGNLIPLSELVNIEERAASQSITRVNRQRAISVFGNLAPGQSQAQVIEKARAMAQKLLPQGYSVALEGAAAGFSESFKSLSTALVIGILVAYLILAVQFNSFIHPISVLVALPFSVTGALVALWAMNYSLNLFSFIGLIVLMGIAKKNSIMLVEFTNHVRKEGKHDVRNSLIEACPVRLRPILMTSVATVAAALPLVLGSGIGSEARTPMGLAIIGGTFISTILTLFVVPALYLALVPLENKKKVHHDF